MKKNSMIVKMVKMMLIVIIAYSLILVGTFVIFKSFEKIDQSSMDVLNQQVVNQKNYFENEMINRWSNIEYDYNIINDAILNCLKDNESIDNLINDKNRVTDLLVEISPDLLIMMRKNSVNGAFVVFDNEEEQKNAVWFRDYEPGSNPSDYSDIMLLAGNNTIRKTLNMTMDFDWKSTLKLDDTKDFFYKPITATLRHTVEDVFDFGYWSSTFRLVENGIDSITYSVPLLDKDNIPYGVMGVELSADYLRGVLGYMDLYSDDCTYLLALEKEELGILLSSNNNFGGRVNSYQLNSLDKPLYKQVHKIKWNESDYVYGGVQSLNVYNTNTPFEDDRWYIIGIVSPMRLLSLTNFIKFSFSFALFISILVAIVAAILLSRKFASPIKKLSRLVSQMDPNKEVKLKSVKIDEVDQLSSAVEVLSRNIAKASSRMSNIIEMVEDGIGAFDFYDSSIVMCSSQIYEILELKLRDFSNYESFYKCLVRKGVDLKNDSKNYRFLIHDNTLRFVNIKIVENDGHIIGVVKDITKDMLEKQRIEYDRDHDALTNLYNRRAFQDILTQLFSEPSSLMIGACVFLDLDNLKEINDTYGHDFGDLYIQKAASVMQQISQQNIIVSRMSGDEFYIFFYGFNTKDEIRAIFYEMWRVLRQSEVRINEEASHTVKASAGIAWYPDDSSEFSELLTLSDFAMYKAKKTSKGRICEFDKESYISAKNADLMKQDLLSILKERRVKYAFQPIIDATNGEVFGYEALMRVDSYVLSNPLHVIEMAKQYGMLDLIEEMTMFDASSAFTSLDVEKQYQLFINSLPTQIMSESDCMRYKEQFNGLLKRLVVEIIEVDQADATTSNKKRNAIANWGSELAIDDFGAGYNNEIMLLDYNPQYLKIDMSLIKNIHLDEMRYEMVKNIITTANKLSIKCVGEGVEIKEEMDVLIQLGIDYLQGYYLGVPAFDLNKVNENIKAEIIESFNNKK